MSYLKIGSKVFFLGFLMMFAISCAEDETDEGFEYEKEAGVVQNALSVLAFNQDGDSTMDSDGEEDYEGLDLFDLEDCYTFVYPITISFPDGTTETVDSYEQLESILEDWDAMSMDSTNLPTLNYPVQLLDTLGMTIDVASDEELITLVAACEALEELEEFDCFDLVYPVTLVFPDASTVMVQSFEEFQSAITTWYTNNPDDEAEITFMYPVQIEMNGEVSTINSDEEFEPILEGCEDEEYEEGEEDYEEEDEDYEDYER